MGIASEQEVKKSCKIGTETCRRTNTPLDIYFIVGGQVVRWAWVIFQCRGMIIGQGLTALVVSAGGGCLDIFTIIYPFSPLSPCRLETIRYRLKYCLKRPLNPKQPTNQLRCIATPQKYDSLYRMFLFTFPQVTISRKNCSSRLNHFPMGQFLKESIAPCENRIFYIRK